VKRIHHSVMSRTFVFGGRRAKYSRGGSQKKSGGSVITTKPA
jgi:hypothetical protein